MATNNRQFSNYANPVNIAKLPADINTPYSFKDWKKIHTGIIPSQEYEYYNQYLADWFTGKKIKLGDFNVQLRLDYLNLLRQLQLFLTTEEKQNWYNNIDLNSEKEILLAIPFFAKKLKEIAVYYFKIREEIKKTKIKYNLVGTNTGIIQQLQEQLLNTFTKKPNSYTTIPATIWSGIPALSSVKDNLTIEIEELYDDHDYFDQSPSVPLSSYFSLSASSTETYLNQKGFQLSAIDWIYKTGNFYTQLNQLVPQLSTIETESLEQALQYAETLLTKYLGTEKYTSQFTGISSRVDSYQISLNEGNNFFYWPYGPYPQNIDTITRYTAVPLSATGLELSATPGLTIEEADTIFVKTARGMEGAWLKLKPTQQTNQNVVTYIEGNTKTIFKYPFPGYGLSSENINWTGPQTTYTPEYTYLNPELKKLVEKEYWNFNAGVSSIEPIKINDTTLINVGSYANTQYELADKIRQWKSVPAADSSVYSGDIIESWLYKMLKTDISIATNFDTPFNNVIFWPYSRIDTEVPFPAYFPSNISTACQPTNLSEIYLPFATASDTLSSNLCDVIYKIPNYQSTEKDAYEVAWLCGPKQTHDTNFEKPLQDSLCHVFLPGSYTQFIWDGPDNTDIEQVFTSYTHQPDCPFYNSLSATSENHELCNCGQTIFSPFGHPGELFIENNQFADFIAEDTQYPEGVNLTTWTDSLGNRYDSSDSFAWYQTTNDKIGWGYGNWKTGMGATSNKFYFRSGKRYVYYRVNSKLSNLITNPYPALVVRYAYNTENTVWKKATKDEYGTWVQTNLPSDMVINPGDILLYKKSPSVYQNYNFTSILPLATAVNTGSIWSNYDYVSLYPDSNGKLPTISYQYPVQSTVSTPANINTFLPILPTVTTTLKQIGWRHQDGTFQTSITNRQKNSGKWTPIYESASPTSDINTPIGWRNKAGTFKVSITKTQQNNGQWTPVYGSYSSTGAQLAYSPDIIKQIQQAPTIAFTSITNISAWVLTSPPTGSDGGGVATSYIPNTFNFTFTPYLTGLYNVRAIAITALKIGQANTNPSSVAQPLLTGFYYINNIPSLTANYLTTTYKGTSSLYVPVPGYVMNVPLYGWNYRANTFVEGSLGARPFWALGFYGKNEVTQFKGIQSWGTPFRLVDGHNILSQPIISDNIIETGDYIEYERKYPVSFIWSQPATFNVEVNERIWSTLVFETTSNSNLSPLLGNLTYNLVTSATDIPSNLSFTNVIDNELVEVYYNSLNPFVWNINVEPEITETVINSLTSTQVITPDQPWNNISNRYFPTLALFPTLESLYSNKDTGGYFVPQNLGTSLYLNKEFTTKLNLSSSALLGIFNDGADYPAGRGLTKEDQPTPYTEILDNNIWLKEPTVSGTLAGTIKKSVSKKYQKFIPYQSEFETNPKLQTGLVLPTSRQSPWGGPKSTAWTDLQNNPTSFTGVPNISAWTETQLLKRTGKQLDCWVTDVYGNQYGLYKNIQNIEPFSRRFVGGELWTRKNSQLVSPASKSLSGVFDTYTNTSLQNELYGSSIRKIDLFFDTLYVETSGTVLLEKIVYNYDSDYIYSVTDDTRFLSLAMPVSASLKR